MKPRTALVMLLMGAALLTSGGLFKVFHWPSASIQLLLGGLLLVVALLVLAIHVAQGRLLPNLR